jgi:uncharacterized protein (DUF1501 family)
MAITRRQFIKRSGLVTAGSLLGPGLLSNVFVRQALASTIGDRYFVVIYLDGGNDGLNTVIPAANGSGTLRTDYDTARSNINVTPGQLAGTLIGTDFHSGAQLGLHPGFDGSGPGMGGFKGLWDAGKLAVIQGSGYPDYNLSHDESRTIWQTANPLGYSAPGGWVGRYLANSMYGGSDIPGVVINGSVVGEFKQSATSVLAIGRLDDIGFPYDYFSSEDVAFKREAFKDLYQAAAGTTQATFKYLGGTGVATLDSSESYAQLASLYETDRATQNQWYDDVDGSLAGDLREVAKVIYGVATGQPNVDARFFQVSTGGYDTHSDQGGAVGYHHDLHKELSDAVKVFYEDLKDMGLEDKVCILTWSEFSRRIQQNGSGTDHGSQGPMFVIGGKVNGGVYGNHPNIAVAAQDDSGNTVYTQDANPFRSTDLRDVYGTVLKHWLNMPHATILSSVLPLDAGDPATYWTAENFDMQRPSDSADMFAP